MNNHTPKKQRLNIIDLQSTDNTTSIEIVPQRGAIVSSWKVNRHQELLFQHQYFWDENLNDLPGGIPFCFPNCGRLELNDQLGRYQVDNKTYNMPIHGFAWQLPWTIEDQQSDSIQLALQSSTQTRMLYPFDFKVQLIYRVTSNQILCQQRFCNTGNTPMPYSAGFHPYFLTEPKQEYTIDFNATQRYQYNNQLTEVAPHTSLLKLPQALSAPEINEQLNKLSALSAIEISHPKKGRIIIQSESKQFNHLQLYTDPELPFFCAEPWMSPPNALNHPESCQWLAPGQQHQSTLRFKFQAN